MATKPFTVQLDTEVIEALEQVADGSNTRATQYATLVLNTLSKLKPDFALHAITAIPKDYFRARPGRPVSKPPVDGADEETAA